MTYLQNLDRDMYHTNLVDHVSITTENAASQNFAKVHTSSLIDPHGGSASTRATHGFLNSNYRSFGLVVEGHDSYAGQDGALCFRFRAYAHALTVETDGNLLIQFAYGTASTVTTNLQSNFWRSLKAVDRVGEIDEVVAIAYNRAGDLDKPYVFMIRYINYTGAPIDAAFIEGTMSVQALGIGPKRYISALR